MKIQTKVVRFLIIFFALFSTIWIAILSLGVYLKEKNDFVTETQAILKFLSMPASKAVFETDDLFMKEVLETALKKEFIISAKLTDQDNELILEKKKKNAVPKFFEKDSSLKLKIKLERDGDYWGDLHLESNNYFLFKKVTISFLQSFLSIFFQAIILILLLFYFLKKILVGPLRELNDMIKELMLTKENDIEILPKDNLEIKEIKTSVNQLLTDLTSSKDELKNKMSEIKKQNDIFSEIHNSLRKLLNVRKETVERSNEIQEESNMLVSDGVERMKEFSHAITILSGAITNFDKNKEELFKIEDLIINVGKRIDKIKVIASESRLLTFNASIEAAHAGRFGLGFLVISEKMNELADFSGNLAKEGKDIAVQSTEVVVEILSVTKSLIEEIKTASDRWKSQVMLVNETFMSLKIEIDRLDEYSSKGNEEFKSIQNLIEAPSKAASTEEPTGEETDEIEDTEVKKAS